MPKGTIGRFQVLFGHKKQWSPPLGFGMHLGFKCYSCHSIAIKKQLKDLTHMFYLNTNVILD
jgi:hypothetical protein